MRIRTALIAPYLLPAPNFLVAKEFVAAQPPEDPDAVVEAIELGLTMPPEERRERWSAMFEYISKHDIAAWRRDFLAALASG